MMNERREEAVSVLEAAKQIAPILAGRPPDVQSAILGELVSIWLSGCEPAARENIFSIWLELVRKLIPANEKILLEKYPNGWTEQ